ncbi:hypothetical protein [Peptoniphilus harei]|uniref:hypothetical protein n=1 Tax=Peptoniphilus harei TaxID=54005 RepID=UPI0011DCBE1D|nr:hypothetical protein [Peptoniphilus harei]
MTKDKKEWLKTSLIIIILSIAFLVFKYNKLDTNNFAQVFNYKTLAILLGIISLSTLAIFFFVDEKRYKDTKSVFIYMIILIILFSGISYFRYKNLTGLSQHDLLVIETDLKKMLINFGIYMFAFFGTMLMLTKNDKVAEEIEKEKEEAKKNIQKIKTNKKKKKKK